MNENAVYDTEQPTLNSSDRATLRSSVCKWGQYTDRACWVNIYTAASTARA